MNAKNTKRLFNLPIRKLVKARGFALVITLALMVLLTMLLVGLLTLSSVALRTVSQSNAMAMARSNARLALIVAIGQLQKAGGPDQRVTAPADLAGDTGGLRLADGKAPRNDKSINSIPNGMSVVKPGTRYWTGVWNTVVANAPASQIYTKTPSATGVQWLISGNELSSATPQVFTPASSVAALTASGTVDDKSAAVVLVGAGSVGAASSTTVDNFVSAPLVGVAVPDPLGGVTRGRYAWWIGDEGVKARFNRVAQISPSTPVTYPTLANQRAGWEVVPPLTAYPTPDAARHPLLERLVTLPEAKILQSSLVPSAGSPVALFHTATTDSFGVLADSLQGGLRLDMTALLANKFSTPTKSTFPNAPKLGNNIIPLVTDSDQKISSTLLKGPKWDTLKAYYDIASGLSSGGKLTVKPALSTNGTDIAIAPIVLDLRLLMGAKVIAIDSSSYRINPCGKIAVSLANPYPYTLEWKSNLELEIIDETPLPNGHDTRIWNAAGACSFLGRKGHSPAEPAVFNNAVFIIPKGQLPPGEARAYTLGGHTLRPANDLGLVSINLVPFSTSSPANFSNCVEMQVDDANSGNKSLDVRESWTTSQPTAELRLAGGSSATPLRRLERFELDDCYFGATSRNVTPTTASSMTEPFPLHLYAFQLSQPGAAYQDQLPSGLMGTRSSTLRTFADFNLRATHFGKLITSYNPPPYFMQSSDNLNDLPFNPPGGETGTAFFANLNSVSVAAAIPWGRASVGSVKKAIFFSFPQTLVSLAQLQHADLTADDSYLSISQQPGNALGNSYATPFVKRQYVIQSRKNYVVTGNGGESIPTAANYYDISYLLNAALFDTYYFSTIGTSQSREPLNKSITIINAPANASSLNDPVAAAGNLMINGAFNINSTNKDAWKALLAGNRFLKHPADTASGSTDAMFPRSLEQTSPSATPPSGAKDDSFSGYRRLTSQEIDAVAGEIVKQVRLRGPFVSLSHFVNRGLVGLTSSSTGAVAISRSGALQSALDNSGVNITPDGKKSDFSNGFSTTADTVIFQFDEASHPKADVYGGQFNNTRGTDYEGVTADGDPVWASQSQDLNVGSVASILADRPMLTNSQYRPEQGFRSTGIPGWVTQADVLQAIGPSIAARSDTFRIRSYGEALSPDGKTVIAKACCEAVVQRMPDYIDASNTPSERLTSLSDTTSLTPLNKRFGRKFEIVSFRWLSQIEI